MTRLYHQRIEPRSASADWDAMTRQRVQSEIQKSLPIIKSPVQDKYPLGKQARQALCNRESIFPAFRARTPARAYRISLRAEPRERLAAPVGCLLDPDRTL